MVDWKGRNVLVTGATGFLGSRLVERLHDAGANVIAFVHNINRGMGPLWEYSNVVQGDICDFDTVRECVSHYEVDTIFHFAAFAIVRVSARDPVSTYRVNVMGTVNVLEAVRSVGNVDRIVIASSDKAYGDHDKLPYTEFHPLQPRNTYDTSKACMDMVARTYGHNYDMPIIVTRCSNVYGPGDPNFSRIVPNTVLRALRGLPPQLYSDVERMEREFVYVDDVIDAYELLATDEAALKHDSYNIGGTGPTKIRDIAQKIAEICELDGEPEIVEREPRFREIGCQFIDASRLNGLGWSPKTSLDDGLRETVEYYRDIEW